MSDVVLLEIVPCFLSSEAIDWSTYHDEVFNMSLVMRKPAFAYAKTKTRNRCEVIAQLISAFVFAIRIVQSLYYLNPKFQTSSHFVWLYSLVYVGPGRKPRRPVLSQRGSYNSSLSVAEWPLDQHKPVHSDFRVCLS